MSTPGFKITTVHAFICTEPDGTEGIPAMMGANKVWHPMVCADQIRIEEMRPIAAGIQRVTGRPMVLAKFSVRENVEEIRG